MSNIVGITIQRVSDSNLSIEYSDSMLALDTEEFMAMLEDSIALLKSQLLLVELQA